MLFAKEFFDLQFSFAERVRDLAGIPLEAALFEYTNFYVRFGLGRDFSSQNETWQTYLAGLRGSGDGREWTYRFYLGRSEATTAPAVVATFGCFSYAVPDGDHVRLHFRATEADGCSPLGAARTARRRAELSGLFAHLKPRVNADMPVVGASWLYNLHAYRRLFPARYASTAVPIRGGYRSMPLWGQFLDRRGHVRAQLEEPFLRATSRSSSLEGLEHCFPFRALSVSSPASEFYHFYGV
jgi:hypothetical protein